MSAYAVENQPTSLYIGEKRTKWSIRGDRPWSVNFTMV